MVWHNNCHRYAHSMYSYPRRVCYRTGRICWDKGGDGNLPISLVECEGVSSVLELPTRQFEQIHSFLRRKSTRHLARSLTKGTLILATPAPHIWEWGYMSSLLSQLRSANIAVSANNDRFATAHTRKRMKGTISAHETLKALQSWEPLPDTRKLFC